MGTFLGCIIYWNGEVATKLRYDGEKVMDEFRDLGNSRCVT